jgi:hypothetical protein
MGRKQIIIDQYFKMTAFILRENGSKLKSSVAEIRALLIEVM